MSHEQTPAEVLRASLVDGGVGTLPSATPTGAWPIYVGHMPDKPDAAVCVYDTAGFREGRVQATGESIGKPGWEIMVRSATHTDAIGRMRLIIAHLDGILRETVVVDGDTWEIQAVSLVSTVIDLGQEPESRRRFMFSLNGTMTHKEVS